MIEPGAGGRHSEHVGGSAITIRVEFDLEILHLLVIVATAKRCLNRSRAQHASADIEG